MIIYIYIYMYMLCMYIYNLQLSIHIIYVYTICAYMYSHLFIHTVIWWCTFPHEAFKQIPFVFWGTWFLMTSATKVWVLTSLFQPWPKRTHMLGLVEWAAHRNWDTALLGKSQHIEFPISRWLFLPILAYSATFCIIYIYASLYISHIITCFGPFFDKQSFVTFGCASRLWSSVSSHLVIGHILALALLELRVSIAWLLRYIGLSCSGTNGHGHQDTDVDDSRNLAARSELAKPCRIEGHAVHCLKVSIDLIDFVWTSKGWTLHYLIWHYIGHW